MAGPITWNDMWFEFGTMASLFLACSAVIAWQLDKEAPTAAWTALSFVKRNLTRRA